VKVLLRRRGGESDPACRAAALSQRSDDVRVADDSERTRLEVTSGSAGSPGSDRFDHPL
jgi:hypothetical protein